jgi:hypothetical protein
MCGAFATGLSWPPNPTGSPMSIVALRLFVLTLLPVVAAGTHIVLDKSYRSRELNLKTFLLYLFGLAVAGGGIGWLLGELLHLGCDSTIHRLAEGQPFSA